MQHATKKHFDRVLLSSSSLPSLTFLSVRSQLKSDHGSVPRLDCKATPEEPSPFAPRVPLLASPVIPLVPPACRATARRLCRHTLHPPTHTPTVICCLHPTHPPTHSPHHHRHSPPPSLPPPSLPTHTASTPTPYHRHRPKIPPVHSAICTQCHAKAERYLLPTPRNESSLQVPSRVTLC